MTVSPRLREALIELDPIVGTDDFSRLIPEEELKIFCSSFVVLKIVQELAFG